MVFHDVGKDNKDIQKITQINSAYSQDLCHVEETVDYAGVVSHYLRVKERDIVSLLKTLILGQQIGMSQNVRWEITVSCHCLKTPACMYQSFYCQGLDPREFTFSLQELFAD